MAKDTRNIKYIKLNNGEDLIAEIETENELEYNFKNPMKVIIDTDMESSRQIIFMHPWLPTGIVQKNNVQLHASIILLTSDILDDVREYYVNMTEEIAMNEMMKKKQQRKKKAKNAPPEADNVLNFSDLLERLKKDKPIH